MQSFRRLAMGRNAVWLLGSRVAADGLNFLLFLVVSRRFGPEGMGEYGYGFALAGLVYYASTLGIDEYGILEYTRRAPENRRTLIAELLGAQLCIALLVLAVLCVYLLLTEPSLSTLVIVASLTTYQVGSALASTMFVPAMAEQRMMHPALSSLLCRGFAFIVAGLLIWVWHVPLQLALLAFIGTGVFMVILSARSAASFGARLRPNFSAATVRESGRRLWSFAAIGVLGQSLNRIGVIVLSLQVGAAAAGIYAAGLKLVEVGCMPLFYIGIAAYPWLCQAFAERARFERLARRVILIGISLALLVALVMHFAVPLLLVPVLGERYAGAEPAIAAMAAIIFVQGTEIAIGRLLMAANMSVARAARVGLGAIVCVMVTVIATPEHGIYGTIAAVVLSYLLINLLYAGTLFGTLKRRMYATA